jgi:hypothetical protein
MTSDTFMRDPTSESEGTRRARLAAPRSLDGKTVALLDIGKMRGDEFIDQLERRLSERGIASRRYRKPTNTRVAPTELLQRIAAETQAAIVALSD